MIVPFLLLQPSQSSETREVYHVVSMRPSRLADLLTGHSSPFGTESSVVGDGDSPSRETQKAQSWLPPGLKMAAEDVKGTLTFRGTAGDVKEALSYVRLFDVVPRKVRTTIHLKSPLDRYETEIAAQQTNNRAWTVYDASLNVSIRLTPRINDDNTITFLIALKAANGTSDRKDSVAVVTRIKNEGSVTVRLGTGAGAAVKIQNTNDSDAADAIVLSLSSRIEP